MNLNYTPPLGKTPKSLSKQVANVFALELIKRSLPPLIKYWGIDYRQQHPGAYIEKDDHDMADEDGSDDDEHIYDSDDSREDRYTTNEGTKNQMKLKKAIVQSIPSGSDDRVSPIQTETVLSKMDVNAQESVMEYEPSFRDEIVTVQEYPEYEYAIRSQEVPFGVEAVEVTEPVILQSEIVGQNELSKQMNWFAEFLRKGVEALALDDHYDDPAGFDDDDHDFLQLLPRFEGQAADSDMTSGSGRIHTPDSDEFPMQDPEQLEYLNNRSNRWVKNATNLVLLKYLKRLKSWYDTAVNSGHGGSLMHWMISEAFSEVLDCFVSPRICNSFFRYNLQVMFCQEVGFLGQENMDEIPSVRVCIFYARFLKQLKPFHLRALYTIPMAFAHPAPITVLLKNSKYLRKISISIMLCRPVLKCLRKHCRNITEISAFAGGPFSESRLSENLMFLTFFKGMTKSEVIQSIERKSSVKRSFPNLERFHLHFLSEAHHHFIHCLQYFYPRVKTRFINVITESVLKASVIKDKLRPPYFLQGKGIFSWDSIYIMAGQFTFYRDAADATTELPEATVHSLSVWNNRDDEGPKAALIREMVTRYGCSKVVIRMPYLYLDNKVNIITPYIIDIGKHLTELHILSGKTACHGSGLVAGLNACENLQRFSLNVACFWPVTGMETIALNPLLELKTLSLTANPLIDPAFHYGEEKWKLARFLRRVIMKAPNLCALELLRTPGDVVLGTLRGIGQDTSIQTLVLDNSLFGDLNVRLNELVEDLPSLSYLFLYGIGTEAYVEIKKNFYRTGLQIAYRSTKLCGVEDYS